MTRKDYVAIAAAINQAVPLYPSPAGANALRCVSLEIADKMANDNPRFDRARFLKACGVQS